LDTTQTWAMIGVFTAIMLGGMTLMTTLIMRSTTSAINGLRGEMNARFETVDMRFEAVNARFEPVEARFDARFDAMDAKFAHLDRDVNSLMRRAWNDRDPQ
jgi:hypothetical protein